MEWSETVMKHLLIILSILLLSSPVNGQSSKFESVSQCVLQTMTEKKLTGNKMFEMVKEECERILGKVDNKPVVKKKEKGYKRQKCSLYLQKKVYEKLIEISEKNELSISECGQRLMVQSMGLI